MEQIIKELIATPADIILSPYKYNNFSGESICSVEIWLRDCKYYVLFSELNQNEGASITNSSEQLIQDVFDKFICINENINTELISSECVFMETYDRKQIDLIIPLWNNGLVEKVTWKNLLN